jgi:hypothetical protein
MTKLKTYRAKTKVRKNSGSYASTIPIALVQLKGIDENTILIWELNPETGKMEVYPEEK